MPPRPPVLAMLAVLACAREEGPGGAAPQPLSNPNIEVFFVQQGALACVPRPRTTPAGSGPFL